MRELLIIRSSIVKALAKERGSNSDKHVSLTWGALKNKTQKLLNANKKPVYTLHAKVFNSHLNKLVSYGWVARKDFGRGRPVNYNLTDHANQLYRLSILLENTKHSDFLRAYLIVLLLPQLVLPETVTVAAMTGFLSKQHRKLSDLEILDKSNKDYGEVTEYRVRGNFRFALVEFFSYKARDKNPLGLYRERLSDGRWKYSGVIFHPPGVSVKSLAQNGRAILGGKPIRKSVYLDVLRNLEEIGVIAPLIEFDSAMRYVYASDQLKEAMHIVYWQFFRWRSLNEHYYRTSRRPNSAEREWYQRINGKEWSEKMMDLFAVSRINHKTSTDVQVEALPRYIAEDDPEFEREQSLSYQRLVDGFPALRLLVSKILPASLIDTLGNRIELSSNEKDLLRDRG